ncbi:hypothetical protein H4Q32_029880 [Labeo rohita]|uniref:C2H2-type domain-containing protein n=1 Tax=Labeo rohita TaxID=84645 RepID=A0ABQ8LAE5_LABRO|nr:hypothetical protein H4Q32_029880 [Labeo rohita]
MAFIKEESEDMKIEETFRVKHEDTEEQTDLMVLKEEREVLDEIEEKYHHEKNHHDFKNEEKSSDNEKAHKSKSVHYFTCQQCGKTFTLKGSLQNLMRIHTGETFTCQQCGKCFTQKQNLAIHMRVHTGEKPYTCHQCGQSFRNNKNLYTHIRSHAREIPFTCKLCGKKFSRKEILNAHKCLVCAVETPKGPQPTIIQVPSNDFKRFCVCPDIDSFPVVRYTIDQGCSTLVLEIDFPAEFSSNPDQTHLNQLIRISRST